MKVFARSLAALLLVVAVLVLTQNGTVLRLLGRGGSRSAMVDVGSDAVGSSRVVGEDQFAKELAQGIRRFDDTIAITMRTPYDDIESDAMSRYMLAQVEGAFAAIRKDYPEIFWMSLGTYDLQWESVTGDDVVTLYLQMKYCQSQPSAEAIQARLERVVAEILAEAPAEPAQAARYFHDWIVENTVYAAEIVENDSMEGLESAFNIDGVFLEGSAVCEGYTKAYKLLCERAGIPCVIVFGVGDGENHGWNYVQLEESWYLVDCTWDDPVSSVDLLIWDYFLKGSQSTVGGRRIAEIYRNDSGSYPTLARKAYDEVDQVDGPGQSDIWVDASLLALRQDGPGTAPGERVAVFAAGGGSAPYRFQLTQEGKDNVLFRLDADSGALTVGEESLVQGRYTVEVVVTDSRGYAAVATLEVPVEPSLEDGGAGWIA